MKIIDKPTDTASLAVSKWLPAVGKCCLQTSKLCVEHALWLEVIGVLSKDQRIKM